MQTYWGIIFLCSVGWVIENFITTKSLNGAVTTEGIGADAYRGELLGIYTILSAISYIERYNVFFTSARGCIPLF